jgi:hypothetical protein
LVQEGAKIFSRAIKKWSCKNGKTGLTARSALFCRDQAEMCIEIHYTRSMVYHTCAN